jgi:HlyD family secretion protein
MSVRPRLTGARGVLRLLAPLGPASRRVGEAVARLPGRARLAVVTGLGLVVIAVGTASLWRVATDSTFTATVTRGKLVARLTETGVLKPAQSIVYRSPLSGRETEVVFLAPEGTLVREGDLLVRLEASELERELERAIRDLREARVNLQLAEVEVEEGKGRIESLEDGEGALSVEETQSQLRLAEKRVERLRTEHEGLLPLMERGFITRDELGRTAFELEQAEADLALARRKAKILIEQTHPRDQQRARLLLVQKQAQAENARARQEEAEARVKALRKAIEGCSMYAREPGLVVHEDFLGAGRRRRIRVGDRVTSSQGLVTIPEVERMLVEASVREADMRRVKPGQRAVIRLDAFPDARFPGRVARVGTLARSTSPQPFEGKRFDMTVEVDPTEAELRPEMTARVEVLVGEREDVLLVPVNAVFERDGELVCHVLGTFGAQTRHVDLGDSDGLAVEVVAGLSEGDRVSLADVASGTPGERGAGQPGAVAKPGGGLLETQG